MANQMCSVPKVDASNATYQDDVLPTLPANPLPPSRTPRRSHVHRPKKFFAYFPESNRWVEATPTGAELLALRGQEVIWGGKKPTYKAKPLQVGNMIGFQRFAQAIKDEPDENHILSHYS